MGRYHDPKLLFKSTSTDTQVPIPSISLDSYIVTIKK